MTRCSRARWLFTLALCAVAAAGAAGKDDAVYRDFVRRASGGDASIDFRAFRIACLTASHCDARGDNKDLIAMRRAMQAKEYGAAVKIADGLLERGFVNIEAHMICSEAYEGLKKAEKAKFHHDIALGLIRSILATGDGKTKETAFEVIGTFEEHLLMNVLGLPGFGSQSLIPGKPHSYDLLEVDDPRTGQKAAVYFKIDLFYPMKGL